VPEEKHLVSYISFKYFRSQKNAYQPANSEFKPNGMDGFLRTGIPIKHIPDANNQACL
jgi:hypothetical protein